MPLPAEEAAMSTDTPTQKPSMFAWIWPYDTDTDLRSVGKVARPCTPALMGPPTNRTHLSFLRGGFVDAEYTIGNRCITELSKTTAPKLEVPLPAALLPVTDLLPGHTLSPKGNGTGCYIGSDVDSIQRLRKPTFQRSGNLENRYGLEGLFTDTGIDAVAS